jgi:FAD:protein FMN transferase
MKISCLVLIGLFFLVSCQTKKSEYLKITGFAQGTNYHITYENSKNEDYSNAIDSILKAFDKSCSLYDSTSIISRINKNDRSVEVDDWFIDIFKKSVEVNALSDGALDVTVGPLVRAWGFGPTPMAKHDKAYIDSLLQFVGMDKVQLEGRKIAKKYPGVLLDLNGVAQGYSVDVISKFLEGKGIKNYIVEIGGEVRCKGTNAKNRLWHVGIDQPSDENIIEGANEKLQAIVELNNKSVTTAGNYRKFFVENGMKYSHTIDPKTGFPARNTMLSATVIADDALTADAWDTAFMALGLDRSKEILKKLPGIDVFFIYSDEKGNYQTYCSEGLKKMLIEQK